MNYFTRLGDRLVIKLINYGILLHASFCIGAFGMILLAPFVVSEFYDDLKLADQLLHNPTIVTAPLVNRAKERGDARTGKFLYYLELPNSQVSLSGGSVRVATPYLRDKQVTDQEFLRIYDHPGLADSPFLPQRIVEVPSETNWSSIFNAVRGTSIYSAIGILILQFVLLMFTIYVAIRGYFFIKYGSRRRRY